MPHLGGEQCYSSIGSCQLNLRGQKILTEVWMHNTGRGDSSPVMKVRYSHHHVLGDVEEKNSLPIFLIRGNQVGKNSSHR